MVSYKMVMSDGGYTVGARINRMMINMCGVSQFGSMNCLTVTEQGVWVSLLKGVMWSSIGCTLCISAVTDIFYEYLFDTQLDLFDSDEDVGGDIFEDGDDDGNELVEIDVELRQLGFVVTP
jgi:hypothetical protein